MPENRIPEFSYYILERLNKQRLMNGAQPLYLGGTAGSSGGVGSPAGGFIGQLVQSKVAYDTTEGSSAPTSGSASLVDNLNHIRYNNVTTGVNSNLFSIIGF